MESECGLVRGRKACRTLCKIDSVGVDDIISYLALVSEEKAALQKGMNFGVGKKYSVFLMSMRENAPYANALDPVTGMLTYEGHDEPSGMEPARIRRATFGDDIRDSRISSERPTVLFVVIDVAGSCGPKWSSP